MIKIEFPKDTKTLTPYFTEDQLKKNLFLVAKSDETLLAVFRFMPKKESVCLYECVTLEETLEWGIFDGMIRTLLFKMADLDCQTCIVNKDFSQQDWREYFIKHQFIEKEKTYENQHYFDEFFNKPCAGSEISACK